PCPGVSTRCAGCLTAHLAFPNMAPIPHPEGSAHRIRSGMKETGQATGVGARLKRAREARGITLRELADRTKISTRCFEAIERDDLKRLPAGIFARAFVRTYAAEVGLDPDGAVTDFFAQFAPP